MGSLRGSWIADNSTAVPKYLRCWGARESAVQGDE